VVAGSSERLRKRPGLRERREHSMRKALSCLVLISLVLISSASLARPSVVYAHAETGVSFVIEDVDVSAGGHTISLSLSLKVSVSVEGLIPLMPLIAFSGFGGDAKITILQEAASLTLLYDSTLHNKGFVTPLETTEIPVASVPEGDIYVILSPSLSVNITVEGPASISPEALTWTSEGTKTVKIEHGPLMNDLMSMFAFGKLNLKIMLYYVLEEVAVEARSGGSPVFGHTTSLGALEGSPVVEANVWLVPIIPIVGGIILLAIVVAAVRRRRPPRAPYPRPERWVRCPRCGHEFPV